MATKARLHWFWRGAFAAMVGAACLVVLASVTDYRARMAWGLNQTILPPRALIGSWEEAVIVFLGLGIGPVAVGLVVFSWLTACYARIGTDGEPHCRKCHHILRGLSEPRCLECGEPI